MSNTIIEMRVDDSSVNDKFNKHIDDHPLVDNEDLVQTF